MVAETKYSPERCRQITTMMAAGMSQVEARAAMEVSKTTFHRWRKEYPEFQEAYELGKDLAEQNHISLGKSAMMGDIKVDFKFWKELGKYCHGWTDKSGGGATNNTQINIDQMNVLQDKSNEELIDYIKSVTKEYPELGQIIEHED